MADDRFAPHIEAVARIIYGTPNKHLSTKTELRWGRNGSIKVHLKTGQWYDHENKEGGGVLDLIAREKGLKGAEAFDWIKQQGIEIEERERPQPALNGSQQRRESLPRGIPEHARLAAVYPYVDGDGTKLFEVHRFEWDEDGERKKSFRQRAASGVWSVKGIRQAPYRAVELVEAVAAGYTVYIVEGEKDADNLAKLGIPATCNAMGAGKWPEELNSYFDGAHVIIIPDNDDAGRAHRDLVAASLLPVAKSVKVLNIPGLPPKGDVSDWLSTGGTAEALYDLVETKAVGWRPPDNFQSKFHALPWRNLDDPGPEHEWLVKGILTRGERSMCAGASQAGKSFLILDLALSIARGVPFLGCKTLQGGVVYQAGEGGRGLKKRLRAYRQRHGVKLDEAIPFVLLPAAIDLYGSDDQTDLFIAEVKHWATTFSVPLELVVIDTLSAATPGANENASEDMSRVLTRCAKISEACKAHVMLVHHMNAHGEKPRGHTSVFANLENVIVVKKLDAMQDADNRPVREATVAKQKDGEDGKAIRFVLKKVVLDYDADGDEISSCIVEAPNKGQLEDVDYGEDAALNLSTQAGILLRAIHQAIGVHGTAAPPGVSLPRHIPVVDWARVRETFERMAFTADGEVDPEKRSAALRQALKRNGELLLSKQIIGRQSPWVWLTGKKVKGFRATAVATPEAPAAESDVVI